MKKYYLLAAIAGLFGLNLLYHSKKQYGQIQTVIPRTPATTPPIAGGGAPVAPANPDTTPEGLSWLKNEAQMLGKTDPKPPETIERIRERAARLTIEDKQQLKTVAISPDHPTDERFLAVFVLSESPESPESTDQLQQISQMPIGKTANDRQYSDELVIRMKALEASVKQLSPSEKQSFLRNYLSRVEDPQLAKHARYLQK